MDDIVKAAMAKWPNVPDCYGWLGLDARGRWWMRDDRAQRAGPFAGPLAQPQSRGAELKHAKLIDFIHRNYAADAQGRWFFQNGPQRVFVELEVAPWVWRIEPDGQLVAHTGQPAQYETSWVDEAGRLYLACDLGLGVVHTLDMDRAGDAVAAGRWLPQDCLAQELPARYGFVLSPQATAEPSSAGGH